MDIVERLQGMSMMEAMTWVTADKSKRPENIYSDAADEIERLREALREICEVYAGSEGIPQPMTAAEGYLLSLLMEVVRIAQKALKEKA